MPRNFTPTEEVAIRNAFHWDPGALPYRVLKDITQDALSDLWQECLRGDPHRPDVLYARCALFTEHVKDLLQCATGRRFAVEPLD